MTRRVARRCLTGAAALLITLVVGASSWAQNMFYREVVKDGRIYVFANAQRFDVFDKTGGAEIGVAITRLGFGPNGETVVFDSEDAVNLYLYKHDQPGEVFAKPAPPPVPSPYPSGKVIGLVFGDFYYFADHHDAKFAHQQGFWLRRAYLGYDYAFNDRMNARLRFEMNSSGNLTAGNLVPFVKDAFFNWRFHGKQQARLGIQPTLTIDPEESFWGLRHIEKTPVDLYSIDSSRDFAIQLSGPIGEQGLSYGAQLGNDASQGSETDKFKVVRLMGLYEPRSGLRIEGDYSFGKRPSGQDRKTAKGLVGIKKAAFRAAAEYVWQERKSGTAAADTTIRILSGFGVWDFAPKKASAFARVDSVTGRKAGVDVGLPGADAIAYLPIASSSPFKTFLAGLEFWKGGIRVSPNVEIVRYDADIATDVVPRITFFWTF